MKKVLSDRKNAEVIEQQEKMCEEAKVKAKQNKKRIEEVRKIQKDLRQKFIETNDFINECERKGATVDKQIAVEMEIQKRLQRDMDDYQERIKNLTEYHEKQLKPDIEELSVYENVLQEVVDEMNLFKSKEDFLDRVEALIFAQTELYENDSMHLKGIEEMKANIVKTSNEASLMIAGFENQLIELEVRYKHLQEKYS